MRMPWWMCEVTRKDTIGNRHIRGTTGVAHASEKITERQLTGYGNVMGREKIVDGKGREDDRQHMERREPTRHEK